MCSSGKSRQISAIEKKFDISCGCAYNAQCHICKVCARWVPIQLTVEQSIGGIISNQKHFLDSIKKPVDQYEKCLEKQGDMLEHNTYIFVSFF